MFNPTRLALARQRKKMTQKALAAVAGVSPITLSRWGTDACEPEADKVERVARALAYPLEFFYGNDVEQPNEFGVSFRSLSRMSAKEKDAALAAGALAFMFDDWVQLRFNLPVADLIDMSFEREPASAARSLRQHWGLGERPVGAIIKLLESKGVRVYSLSENTHNVDAFSCWRNKTPYIFLNTLKSAEHSRFDAAHELGHLVLHRHGGPRGRGIEREANEFASSFLMPSADVEAQIPYVLSLDQIVKAKKRWGVSVAALAYRLHKLGRLTEWHYREFCIQLSRLGYRTAEPDGLPREQSVVWNKVLGNLWADRITKAHIAKDLGVPPEEIESILFGLVGGPTEGQPDGGKRASLRLVAE